MFCSKCGSEIKEGDLFCGKCGNEIENESMKENKEVQENENFKMHFSFGIMLFYTIFMFLGGGIISIFCGANSIINIFSIIFGLIGFGYGFFNAFSLKGICPYCKKEVQAGIQNSTTINGYTAFDCPMCGKKINAKR